MPISILSSNNFYNPLKLTDKIVEPRSPRVAIGLYPHRFRPTQQELLNAFPWVIPECIAARQPGTPLVHLG